MLRWMGQSNVIGCEAVCNRPEDMEELEKLQPSTHHCPESKRDYMQLEKMGKERFFFYIAMTLSDSFAESDMGVAWCCLYDAKTFALHFRTCS